MKASALILLLGCVAFLRPITSEVTDVDMEKLLGLKREELRKLLIQKLRDSIFDEANNRAYEERLRELLEQFRELVINGDPDKGIPVLDPYLNDHLELNLDIPNTGELAIQADNLQITGLKDFIVDTINFSIIALRLDYGFTLPELRIVADHYELRGDVMDGMDVTGSGTLEWVAKDTEMWGSAVLGVKEGKLQMKSFDVALNMEQFESKVEGLLDGGDQCVFLNQVLQQLVPSLLITQRESLSEFVAERVMELANRYLAELTLADLVDLIGGGSR